jgi:hypothetical protein
MENRAAVEVHHVCDDAIIEVAIISQGESEARGGFAIELAVMTELLDAGQRVGLNVGMSCLLEVIVMPRFTSTGIALSTLISVRKAITNISARASNTNFYCLVTTKELRKKESARTKATFRENSAGPHIHRPH